MFPPAISIAERVTPLLESLGLASQATRVTCRLQIPDEQLRPFLPNVSPRPPLRVVFRQASGERQPRLSTASPLRLRRLVLQSVVLRLPLALARIPTRTTSRRRTTLAAAVVSCLHPSRLSTLATTSSLAATSPSRTPRRLDLTVAILPFAFPTTSTIPTSPTSSTCSLRRASSLQRVT